MRILHVAAEVHPLIKTGGLADVLGSLPAAQRALGHRVAVLVPGYPQVMSGAGELAPLRPVEVPATPPARLLRGRLEGDVDLLVLDQPGYFERPGGPYLDELGRDWPDNHLRFAQLGRVAAMLCGQGEEFELLHAHDWHAGLAPAYLRAAGSRRASCFTIHNLAYQGRFGSWQYPATGLPWDFYNFAGLEFYGDWSFMKAGLSYSDAITTVSPTYAREILRPEMGMGLQALLNHRRTKLHGILNGVDYRIWNPASDPQLAQNYDVDTLVRKAGNKRALQQELGLEVEPARLVLGVVSRLTMQKGLDLVLEAVEPGLAAGEFQLVLLGSGDAYLESAFSALAQRHPGNCAVRIGYSEAQSHRIVGGADAILVPSRFEPCGLTQLYGLRYATLPLVRRTGGLADTVTGFDGRNLERANGIVFTTPSPTALRRALRRALAVYAEQDKWTRLMANAMQAEFGWDRSAQAYLELYARLGAD